MIFKVTWKIKYNEQFNISNIIILIKVARLQISNPKSNKIMIGINIINFYILR